MMCSTVEIDVRVKKVEEVTQMGQKKVGLQTTRSGIPMTPTRKFDTAKHARIIVLVVLSFG